MGAQLSASRAVIPDMRHVSAIAFVILVSAASAYADPPLPSGAHPRVFMSATNVAAFTANAAKPGSAAAAMVKLCQDTIDTPKDYNTRGGSDGGNWPGAAVACAFAFRATQKQQYLTQAITYWQASLDDDQNIGDKHGCVAGVDTNWQSWATSRNGPAPPVIITVTHDDDYPMRWYGPDVALTYDWLYDAAGVSDTLRAQTRTCLTAWNDFYTGYGYHAKQAGANYNAGFVASKALAAIAIGNDGGADGHLWTQVLTDQVGKLLIGDGLMGADTPVGMPAGALVGGDWLEGWEYGPLSVLEYALTARVLEDNGAKLPALDAWVNSLVVRYVYATVPTRDGQWVGGDFDNDSQIYQGPSAATLQAVLLGPSSDQAAGWALQLMQEQKPRGFGLVYDAIAEIRKVTASDYRMQSPAPSLWYLSRGSRAMYVRSGWDAGAFWGVFSSAPHIVDDHEHLAASNFVLSRGGDHLIVDTSEYGGFGTLQTNALSADSPQLTGNYAQTQTPFSQAELVWARASDNNVFAARSDLAKAFNWKDQASDIPYAHREWVMLPEGEVVTIDRVHTAGASDNMYVNFHANTGGKLALTGNVASGPVGASQLVIHSIKRSGGTPRITQPAAISGDNGKCPGGYPDGPCTDARLAVDIYALAVPGPQATAVHVIDALASGEAPATVDALDDAAIDPAHANGGVIGASVYRGMRRSYVIASSAANGAAGSSLSYGVPGDAAARHIVFDAPEAADGTSQVTATATGGRCAISIVAGGGGGLTGHPLMFSVDAAASGCTVHDGASAPPAAPPVGGGISDGGSNGDSGANGGTSGGKKGHGCSYAGDGASSPAPLALFVVALLALIVVALLMLARRRALVVGVALLLACGGVNVKSSHDASGSGGGAGNGGSGGGNGSGSGDTAGSASPSSGKLSFTDVATATGVAPAAAGIPLLFDVTMEDFDDDGYTDVLLGSHIDDPTTGNDTSRLLFAAPSSPFVVASRPATKGEVWSQLAVDYDNDGRIDIGFNWDSGLFATTVLHNLGARNFEALSPSATYTTEGNSMAWADWDGDGRTEYMTGGFHGNALYQFQNGKYVDVTATKSPIAANAYTQGSLYLADFNGDGWPDILTQPYVGKVSGGIFDEKVTHTTQIFFNNGKRGAAAGFGAGVTAGLDTCPAPGVALGDFDNDGWLDVFCLGSSPTAGRSHFQVRLFRNHGDGTFSDVSHGSGLPEADATIDSGSVIYLAAAFADFDNDGLVDIVWYADAGVSLYRNLGNGKFGDVTSAVGLGGITGNRPSRFAIGDYDNDGALDLVTAASTESKGGAARLMHNQLGGSGFVKLRLAGNKIKNAIGSKVYLYAAGHLGDAAFLRGYREVTLAHSYRHPLEQHFGVAGASDVRVRFWPDGTQVDVTGVAPGTRVRIGEDGTHTNY
jgi:hypothetical protein